MHGTGNINLENLTIIKWEMGITEHIFSFYYENMLLQDGMNFFPRISTTQDLSLSSVFQH